MNAVIPTRVLFSSPLIWTAGVLLGLSVVALVLGKVGYGFALSGQRWFIHFWDNWILSVYSAIEFQHIWWVILAGAIISMLLLTKPWALYQRGGWSVRFKTLIISYTILYTLFLVFAWQLQYYIFDSRWPLVVFLFMLCHFLSIFSIGILSSIANRIPILNEKYIVQTKNIILREPDPIKQIFQSSIYGYMVRRMSSRLFDILGGWVFRLFLKTNRNRKIYEKIRLYFLKSFDVISFAWLFDRLFGGQYYVMHFEMVLRYLLEQEEEKARDELMERALHPALTEYSVPGLFIRRDDTAYTIEGEI